MIANCPNLINLESELNHWRSIYEIESLPRQSIYTKIFSPALNQACTGTLQSRVQGISGSKSSREWQLSSVTLILSVTLNLFQGLKVHGNKMLKQVQHDKKLKQSWIKFRMSPGLKIHRDFFHMTLNNFIEPAEKEHRFILL